MAMLKGSEGADHQALTEGWIYGSDLCIMKNIILFPPEFSLKASVLSVAHEIADRVSP